MAWQNSVGMGGSGGSAASSSEAGGNGSQPAQGTEYTLQGVMRFLQTQWHRHERDRNAWQIERAEMKSRIGKLEGDLRTNKKLRESMDKHIRMLENVLKKKEQEKRGKGPSPETETGKTSGADSKQSAKSSPTSKPKPRNSFLDFEHEDPSSPGLKHEAERDRSRVYMGKCIEEFAYHVFSSVNTQQHFIGEQEQIIHNNQFVNQQHPQDVSLADVYAQQRQKQQQNSIGSLGPSPLPNHQPPPIPRVSEVPPLSRGSQQTDDSMYISRNPPTRQSKQQSGPLAIDRSNPPRSNYGFPHPEEQVEKVAHSYNSYGEPVPSRQDEDQSRIHEEPDIAETDGWNFDDASEPPPTEGEQARQEFPTPQRPDTDVFPNASNISINSPGRGGPDSHKRKTSLSRRRQSVGSHELRDITTSHAGGSLRAEAGQFKVRFALRGHLDVVRSVIFTGGGSPSAPEICTAGDDGVIKRWIAASAPQKGDDLDLKCDQTHRGHIGAVLSLAASPAYQPFSNGGRAQGDGWVFSGGQDATVRVWERGRVDPKATLDGHTDAVWTVCVLPGTSASILGDQAPHHGGPDRTVLVSGAADGTILVWSVSSPPQVASPHTSSRRGTGSSRRANSVSSGSNFPSSPQPNTAGSKPFHYSLIHRIPPRPNAPSPTCICPFSINGDSFVVAFADASVLVYDTRTGEEIVAMASLETYDGTPATGVNAIAATTVGMDGTLSVDSGRAVSEDEHSATGSSKGVEGMILSGHEDRYIRFFDANSGQCTYDMLAHPHPISSLSLSPSGTELVSAGHDASLRFWSLEKRSCIQEVTSHRPMRGEGVCSVVWSQDGRWVVSGGGDGVVKVFARIIGEAPGTHGSTGSGEKEGERDEGWRF
ncbi:MAG: hypothetical protein Q9217_005904 [Psora testacea]